jgi:hypothetical protein
LKEITGGVKLKKTQTKEKNPLPTKADLEVRT